MWKILFPAGVAAGIGGYFLLSRLGEKLVFYSSDIADGRHLAHDLTPESWGKYRFSSVPELLHTLSGIRRISSLTIIAHAGPDWVYDRQLTAQRLAQTIGQKLASGAIVGLAGCWAARGPGETENWVPEAFGPGGARSYAGVLRDWLRRYGAPFFGEVRAHTLRGHTTGNPSARYFPFREVGQAGHGLMPAGKSVQQWVAEFGEIPAHQWITGQT